MMMERVKEALKKVKTDELVATLQALYTLILREDASQIERQFFRDIREELIRRGKEVKICVE